MAEMTPERLDALLAEARTAEGETALPPGLAARMETDAAETAAARPGRPGRARRALRWPAFGWAQGLAASGALAASLGLWLGYAGAAEGIGLGDGGLSWLEAELALLELALGEG